jgi:hypothetical protein
MLSTPAATQGPARAWAEQLSFHSDSKRAREGGRCMVDQSGSGLYVPAACCGGVGVGAGMRRGVWTPVGRSDAPRRQPTAGAARGASQPAAAAARRQRGPASPRSCGSSTRGLGRGNREQEAPPPPPFACRQHPELAAPRLGCRRGAAEGAWAAQESLPALLHETMRRALGCMLEAQACCRPTLHLRPHTARRSRREEA